MLYIWGGNKDAQSWALIWTSIGVLKPSQMDDELRMTSLELIALVTKVFVVAILPFATQVMQRNLWGRTMRACRFWSLCRLLEHCELISLLILSMTTKAKKRGGVKKGLLKLLGIGYYYGKSEVQTAHPSPKACILTPLFNVSISCKPEYVHERSTVWQMNTNWFQQSRNTDRVNFKQLNGW